jgi:hypothetical protein
MIVWLASFPRSGNTMVRILFNKVYGLMSHSLYEERPGEGGVENIASVMGSAGQVTDPADLRAQPGRYFVKTHGLPPDDSPALYVVRDGRDALVSYAHFVRTYEKSMAERYTFPEVLRLLIESRDHFGGWSGNVGAWRARPALAPTVWLRFEDVVRQPRATLDGALCRLGFEPKPCGDAPVTFEDLRRRWPDFFRKGKVGGWREELTGDLERLFWQHHGEAMDWLGYPR